MLAQPDNLPGQLVHYRLHMCTQKCPDRGTKCQEAKHSYAQVALGR